MLKNGQMPHAASVLLAALTAGLILNVSLPAHGDPSGSPLPNRIFFNCTFTTADLQSILNIPTVSALAGHQVRPSYIIIYNRQNPNDGQQIGTTSTYTGPVLCINEDTDNVFPTSEGTQIPNATNQPGAIAVDVLGAEEVSNLQYKSVLATGPGNTEKRVCHTAAGNTDCFLIQPAP
jgi:hypothetical protein